MRIQPLVVKLPFCSYFGSRGAGRTNTSLSTSEAEFALDVSPAGCLSTELAEVGCDEVPVVVEVPATDNATSGWLILNHAT